MLVESAGGSQQRAQSRPRDNARSIGRVVIGEDEHGALLDARELAVLEKGVLTIIVLDHDNDDLLGQIDVQNALVGGLVPGRVLHAKDDLTSALAVGVENQPMLELGVYTAKTVVLIVSGGVRLRGGGGGGRGAAAGALRARAARLGGLNRGRHVAQASGDPLVDQSNIVGLGGIASSIQAVGSLAASSLALSKVIRCASKGDCRVGEDALLVMVEARGSVREHTSAGEADIAARNQRPRAMVVITLVMSAKGVANGETASDIHVTEGQHTALNVAVDAVEAVE